MTSQEYPSRAYILEQVRKFHAAEFHEQPFIPGETVIQVSGRFFDAEDSEQCHVLRAQIALLAEAGWSNTQIAQAVGCTLPMVQ